jgi:ketosteroid isomerase-like protein
MTDKATVVRRYLGAYQHDDRAALEACIADNFRFTSPEDDAIDRVRYFQHCWPNHGTAHAIDVERVVEDGNAAYVTYMLRHIDGRSIHNTERVTFEGDKINGIEVFFGRVIKAA